MNDLANQCQVPMVSWLANFILLKTVPVMIRNILTLLVLLAFIASCGVRPQYKTAKGKKKNRYYNSIQYQKP